MGYQDDFYIPENIVGYTGDIKKNPTVYFERKEKDGSITFGRITQQHDNKENEGREIVRKSKDYKRENTYYNRSKGPNESETYSLLTDDRKNEKVVKESKNDFTNQLIVAFEDGKSKYYCFSCVESYFGGIQHVSRTPFTDVEKSQIKELSKSISNFENIKTGQKEYADIDLDKIFEENNVLDIPTSKGKQKEKRKAALPKNGSDILSSDKFKKKVKNPKVALQDNELAILSSGKSKKDLAKLAVQPKKNPRNNAPIKVSSGQVKKKEKKGNVNNLNI